MQSPCGRGLPSHQRMSFEPQAEIGRTSATEGPPQLCFVIGRPRSGTTVFKDMLSTHPALFSLGEILNETNERSYFHFLQQRTTTDPRAALPSNALVNFQKYLDWCWELAQTQKAQASTLVLDVKYDQAHLLCEPWWNLSSLPRIFSLIRERGWKVIDIHRKDIVGLVVSNQIAIKTKVYHSTNLPPGESQSAKVHINAARLEREVNTTENSYRRIAEHFRNYRKYLAVSYEEMFDGEGNFSADVLDRVSQFLGVQNRFDAKPKLTKLLDKDLLSYVENTEEVRALIDRRISQRSSGESQCKMRLP
jgi:Sulfotransferase family